MNDNNPPTDNDFEQRVRNLAQQWREDAERARRLIQAMDYSQWEAAGRQSAMATMWDACASQLEYVIDPPAVSDEVPTEFDGLWRNGGITYRIDQEPSE